MLGPALGLAIVQAGAPTAVLAGDGPATAPLFAITLDMDRDGKTDRAAVVQDQAGAPADLYVWLADGERTVDPTRQPDVLKKGFTTQRVLGLDSAGDGALTVTYGCGGCSNDVETTLTIMHRGGMFIVARFALAWDTRTGIGQCDIDFLSGKRVVTRGLDGTVQASATFPPRPIRLADWSGDTRPEGCDP